MMFPGIAAAQSNEQCLVCHSESTLVKHQNGQEIQLYVDKDLLKKSVHESLNCVDCHHGFNPAQIPHATVIETVACQTCHDVGAYDKSIHGQALGGAGCSECHGTHYILAPGNPESRVNRGHLDSTCGKCHQDETERYMSSKHGSALAQGSKSAPSCADCHGSHTILPASDPDSALYKTKEPAVCLKCHLDNPEVRRQIGISAGFIADYKASIHGVTLASGDLRAPSCSDCHGAHDMAIGSNPKSLVSKFKIPDLRQVSWRDRQDLLREHSWEGAQGGE